MSEFLTKKQLLASGGKSLLSRKPKRFFVELYRNGKFRGKGMAFIGYSRESMVVNNAISNTVHSFWNFEFKEMVSDTEFSMGREGDVMQFKKDHSPLQLNQYSYY